VRVLVRVRVRVRVLDNVAPAALCTPEERPRAVVAVVAVVGEGSLVQLPNSA